MFPHATQEEILAAHPAPWNIFETQQPGRYTMVDKNGREVPLGHMLLLISQVTANIAAGKAPA